MENNMIVKITQLQSENNNLKLENKRLHNIIQNMQLKMQAMDEKIKYNEKNIDCGTY